MKKKIARAVWWFHNLDDNILFCWAVIAVFVIAFIWVNVVMWSDVWPAWVAGLAIGLLVYLYSILVSWSERNK